MKTVPINRRVFLQSSTAVAAGVVLSPAIVGRAEAATLKMKCSSSLPNDPKYANGRVYYDNLVKHLKANGLGEQVEVTFFPDNQLGQEIDVINSVKLGVIDLMISGSSISANLVPLVGTFDLGYLFSSFPQQTKAFDAGAAKPIEDALLKGANIRIISWAYNFGSRSVLAKKPVKGPEDLAGLKIRTLPNPVITECLRLMGAAATPLAFGEIYTALQAGVLDGLEHDPPTILASKFCETSKHYALTQHNFSPLATYFSEVTFNRMDPKLREGFLDCRQKGRGRYARPRPGDGKGSAQESRRQGRHHRRMRQGSVPQARAAADRQFHQGAPRGEARGGRDPRDAGLRLQAMSVAVPASSGGHRISAALLTVSDVTAAILLVADLLVVCGSVLLRFLFNAPVEWADDVARGLMVGSSFFGAASALARSENLGVAFFIDMLPGGVRRVVDAVGALLVTIIAGYVAFNAIKMGWLTTGQTSGSGLPLEWTFYPMGVGALFMTVFAFELFCTRPLRDMVAGIVATAIVVGLYLAWDFLSPNTVPSSNTLMLVGFFLTLFGGLADRLCAGAGGADLHLGGGHAARRDLRAADGARHRQFRVAGDPVLHPRRLSDGSQRHVGAADRIAAAGGRAHARRIERRDGDVDGAVLGHLRLQDGRCRRRRLGADPGGAALPAESRQRGGAIGGVRGDGGNHSALHQSDHPRLRRQSLDRRPVRRGHIAGRPDGAGADRALHHSRQAPGSDRRGRAADSRLRACGAARSPRSG